MAFAAPDIVPEPIRPPHLESQTTQETFGGGAGLEQVNQQAQNISRDAGDIAAFEKIKADKAASEEVMSGKVSPYVTDRLYNPNTGAIPMIAKAQSNKEAMDILEQTNADINNFSKKAIGGLSNGNQIGSAVQRMYPIADNVNKTLMAHVDTRMKKIYSDSFDSGVTNITTQAALGNGLLQTKNAQGVTQQQQNLNSLNQLIGDYGQYNGLTPDQVQAIKSKTISGYHSAIIDQKLADGATTGNYDDAKQYAADNKKDITDLDIRANVEKNLVTVPLQNAERAKRAQELAQEQNERDLFTKAFKGELLPNDPIKAFQNNQISVSGFKTVDALVHDKDYLVGGYKAGFKTDPGTFNSIRQDQITGKPQLQISYDIAQAKLKGKLDPNDAKYLDSQTSQMKPNGQNEDFNAAVSDIRHFAQNFYVPEHRFLSSFIGDSDEAKAKASSEVEHVVKDFTMNADRQRLSGEDLQKFTENTKDALWKARFPGSNRQDGASVAITAKGDVVNAFQPNKKLTLKGRYKLIPNEPNQSQK